MKIYALFLQHLLQTTMRTVIAAKWFAIRNPFDFPDNRSQFCLAVSWFLQLQKDTFHSLGFYFLVTDSPWNLFYFRKFCCFRVFLILKAIPAVLPPPQTTEMILLWWSCLHQCVLSPHSLVSSHSPKIVSIRLIGKSKLPPSVSVPKKVSRQTFLPLTRWLLGSAPVCPVKLMINKRWLTEKRIVERRSDEMIVQSCLGSCNNRPLLCVIGCSLMRFCLRHTLKRDKIGASRLFFS